MCKLVMNDLPMSVELDRTALKAVCGGYLKYQLENVRVSSYQTGGSADEQPANPVKAATALEYAIIL